jgi:hypothetical protein
MEGVEGHGSPFWGGKGGCNASGGHYAAPHRYVLWRGEEA